MRPLAVAVRVSLVVAFAISAPIAQMAAPPPGGLGIYVKADGTNGPTFTVTNDSDKTLTAG
jgi:hypothetical protein